MTKIKKFGLILAVTFVAAIGAGWLVFDYVADMVQATLSR